MEAAAILLVAVLSASFADTNIPSYVKLCKRHDANLNKCLLGTVESVRSHLGQGIKEMGIPPLDPLEIEAIDDADNNLGLGLCGFVSDVKISRGSNFVINDLCFDQSALKTYVDITFPRIDFTADYNGNGSLVNFPVKAKGRAEGGVDNLRVKVNLTSNVAWRDKKEHLKLVDVKLHATWSNYSIPKVEKLAKQLNITPDDRLKIIELLKPTAEYVVGKFIILTVNKILDRVSYTDFLPNDAPGEPIPPIAMRALLAL